MKKNILLVFSLFSLVLYPVLTFAHGHNEFHIGGKTYNFTVGSLNEPVTVDDKTGVDLRITEGGDEDHHSTAKAVPGLEKDLKVEISAGDKKKVLELVPAYNDPGAYRAYFIPTVQTTYTYRVFGKINGVELSLPFICNPAGHVQEPEEMKPTEISPGVVQTEKAGGFGCPLAKSELGFPEPASSLNDLSNKAETLSRNVLETSKKANNLNTLAIAALALAVVGVVMGFKANFKR